MMYYARTNTADPRVGLITVGEYLTDAQVKALGKEMLDALVERGVLGIERDGAQPVPVETENNGADGENNSADGENNGAELAEDAPEDDGEEDGVPELSVSDVIVNDAEDAAKPAPRKTRRNSK